MDLHILVMRNLTEWAGRDGRWWELPARSSSLFLGPFLQAPWEARLQVPGEKPPSHASSAADGGERTN